MKILWIYVCIVIIILTFSGVCTAKIETEDSDEKNCNSNMSPYMTVTSLGPKLICAYISPESQKWDDAKTRCSLLYAQISQQIRFKSSLRIDLLNKGIDVVWAGIRRRNNFFVTEYPSKPFREVDDSFSPDYWGYHWSDAEPATDDCVALNISNGSLQTRNCNDNLRFVCDDGGRDDSIIIESSACPEGFNLSFALSSSSRTCISFEEPLTYENAEEVCAYNNGRLATFHEYNILTTKKMLSPLDNEPFWIKKITTKLCEATRKLNEDINKTFPASCTFKYPFVCVIQYKTESIKVHLVPKSVNSAPSDSENTEDLLTCYLDTESPKNLNVESNFWFQWYKDDVPLPINSYVMRLSFNGDTLKRDPYLSDIASRQGYYHCEAQLPGSNEVFSSSKMKFFYSDIATYVVEIHGIKQISDMDYSHQNFLNYMDDFDEASMSNVLEKVKVRYPVTEWDFMSKSILEKEVVMGILVYIYKTSIEAFDERMACEDVKEAFQELHSVPVYMEDMSVHINCEEFPLRNGYVQVIKNLKSIEDRLNHMEEMQEDILEKLEYCQAPRIDEPPAHNYDFDVPLFLEAVEDLKRLENHLLHKTPKSKKADTEDTDRERNEFEDNSVTKARKRFFDKAKELTPERTPLHSNARDFVEELDEEIPDYSDWKENQPNRDLFQKDL